MVPVHPNPGVLRRDLLAVAQTVGAGALLVAVVVASLGLVTLTVRGGSGRAWAGHPVGLTRPAVPGPDQIEAPAPAPAAPQPGIASEPAAPASRNTQGRGADPRPAQRTQPGDDVLMTPPPTPEPDPEPDPEAANAVVELAEDLAGAVTGTLGGLLP